MNRGKVPLAWGVEGVAVFLAALFGKQRSYRITGLALFPPVPGALPMKIISQGRAARRAYNAMVLEVRKEVPVRLMSTHRRERLAYLSWKDEVDIGNSGSVIPFQAVASVIFATFFTLFLASAFAIACQTQTNPPAGVAAQADGKHTITVNFTYDFSKTPSCSERIKTACIVQFNVYEISAGAKSRTKLFSIPAPPGETKPANGITGKSPRLSLEPGKHELAVTAQMSNGKESNVTATTTWVDIPPHSK